MIDIANFLLKQILEWGIQNGLKFAPHKTEGVLFHNKKAEPKVSSKLEMDGKVIELKKEVKYLGITISNRLKWNSHIQMKAKECKAKIMAMKNALGDKWGQMPRCMMWFYKSYILSTLTYGSLKWAHSKFAAGERKAINKVERLAMYCMEPIKRSAPQVGLITFLRLTPIEELTKRYGLESFLRNRSNVEKQWDCSLY